MVLSVLVALILSPALCATILKPLSVAEHHNKKGFFGWFNRHFELTTHRYHDLVEKLLNKTGRYLLIYLLIVVGMGYLFLTLPTAFLPEEDQGMILTMIQLPAGATQERTQKVADQVYRYYATKEKQCGFNIYCCWFWF